MSRFLQLLLLILFNLFYRPALACLHYNENLQRKVMKSKEGNAYTKVVYPKYKLGEEVVREVKVQPTYDKWSE